MLWIPVTLPSSLQLPPYLNSYPLPLVATTSQQCQRYGLWNAEQRLSGHQIATKQRTDRHVYLAQLINSYPRATWHCTWRVPWSADPGYWGLSQWCWGFGA